MGGRSLWRRCGGAGGGVDDGRAREDGGVGRGKREDGEVRGSGGGFGGGKRA